MMTLSTINSISYYSDLASEDYYLDGGEPSGEWAGKGATLLGLSGQIDDGEYQNVLSGLSPDGKYELCQGAGEAHRAGWDLCFSAPKSVSVLWARLDEAAKVEIQNIHKLCVKKALAVLEEEAGMTRRGSKGREREPVIGFVAALFEHCTSRAQDPQLHTHCLIANVAPRHDGSWGTIESRDLFFWQKAAGAIYRAELSANLKTLGFVIERDGKAFKVAGVPERVIQHFSKRALKIRQELSKRGGMGSATRTGDFVTLDTRERKEKIDRNSLYQAWSREMDEMGFAKDHFKERINNNSINLYSDWLGSDDEYFLDEELLLEKITEKNSVFRKQDIFMLANEIAQWSKFHDSGAATSIAKKALECNEAIYLGEDEKFNQLFTTQDVITTERDLISSAKRMANKEGFDLNSSRLKQAIADNQLKLSDEQVEAVRRVCTKVRFSILQGSAGAGKSASMNCVRSAYESSGYRVVGAAIAKSAANNLSKEAKIEAHTITKLLSDIERHRSPLDLKTVLLVDEAGQVGTKQLSQLLNAAEKSGSKIILLGEDKQLDAIEHAGCLRYLSQPEVIGTTRIETIRRQREAWARETVANFRDGNSVLALKEYEKRELLNLEADAEAQKEALLTKWDQYRKSNPDKQFLILAQRWKDVTSINESIRSLLQNEGVLSSEQLPFECAIGDKTIKQYFATGERVKLTKNDYKRGYTNGDLGTLQFIQRQGEDYVFKIKLDSGRTLSFKASEYSNEYGHLYMTQAYALTVYASQGLTVDGDVFVYYTTSMDRAHTYVACSRHKDNCHIFANTRELDEVSRYSNKDETYLQTLAQTMGYEARRKLAIEYIEQGSNYDNIKQFGVSFDDYKQPEKTQLEFI